MQRMLSKELQCSSLLKAVSHDILFLTTIQSKYYNSGSADAIRALVEYGANANETYDGLTHIHTAIKSGNSSNECIQLEKIV